MSPSGSAASGGLAAVLSELAEGLRAGPLIKSVCHCCCVEERMAIPNDEEACLT